MDFGIFVEFAKQMTEALLWVCGGVAIGGVCIGAVRLFSAAVEKITSALKS